jgi:hypothetical protein
VHITPTQQDEIISEELSLPCVFGFHKIFLKIPYRIMNVLLMYREKGRKSKNKLQL